MSKNPIVPFAICLFLASGLMAQVKFRNNRFANITPIAVQLANAAEFFSDPNFDAVEEELQLAFKADDLKFVKSRTTEATLPPALNSFEKREANRAYMLEYKLYELARFDDAGLVVCIAPVSENQHMKDRNMIGADDAILVFTTKAFGDAEPEMSDEELEDALAAMLLDVAVERPEIDYSKVKTKNLTEAIRLKMPPGDGTNGASVAFHPDLEMYFATFAGNMVYPLAVFDKRGNRISANELETGFDVRGLWYDSKRDQIWGNGYGDFGWYKLDVGKKPSAPQSMNIEDGALQPGENSVGIYDPIEKSVAFFDPNTTEIAYFESEKYTEKKRLALKPGITDPKVAADQLALPIPTDYNQTTALALGGKKTAFGLLHLGDRQLECYDRATGALTEVWKLPAFDFTINESFNVAFANNTLFLFDIENRVWVGFK